MCVCPIVAHDYAPVVSCGKCALTFVQVSLPTQVCCLDPRRADFVPLHTKAVRDLSWSPLNPDLLATAAVDG